MRPRVERRERLDRSPAPARSGERAGDRRASRCGRARRRSPSLRARRGAAGGRAGPRRRSGRLVVVVAGRGQRVTEERRHGVGGHAQVALVERRLDRGAHLCGRRPARVRIALERPVGSRSRSARGRRSRTSGGGLVSISLKRRARSLCPSCGGCPSMQIERDGARPPRCPRGGRRVARAPARAPCSEACPSCARRSCRRRGGRSPSRRRSR